MRRILSIAVLAAAVAGCASPSPTAPAAQPAAPLTPTASTQAPAAEVTPRPLVADPARIRIPAIGVNAKIITVGLEKVRAGDGFHYPMETPPFGLAGWYQPKEAKKPLPRPGEPGAAVIVAHVDGEGRADVFAKLGQLDKGEKILVTDKQGKTHAFVATDKEQIAKTALPAEKIWVKTDKPVLRLITCGGTFDRASGHYDSNVIVYARAA